MHAGAGAPPIQRFASDPRLVERQHLVTDDLRLLVPLPRQQHKVPWLCRRNRELNRLAPIDDGEAGCRGALR
jgi:hypothetical protein